VFQHSGEGRKIPTVFQYSGEGRKIPTVFQYSGEGRKIPTVLSPYKELTSLMSSTGASHPSPKEGTDPVPFRNVVFPS
jgi:hypothetical protein